MKWLKLLLAALSEGANAAHLVRQGRWVEARAIYVK